MNKLRCAVLDDYQRVALTSADWSVVTDRVDVRVHDRRVDDEGEVAALVGDCEIVVLMRERTAFRRSLIARLPKLKLIVTSGMRNAAIDVEAAGERGVTVCGTASRSEPPAELTWALILALARNLVTEAGSFRTNGPWQSTVGLDLHGRTLGLLGLGNIGSRVARVGAAFGMRVLAWSENLTADRARAAGVELASSKQDLLDASDFVSIHLVLSARTRGLLSAADLRRMKRTAYLVNTSRAAIVDQQALLQALQERWIAGAGLDVFEEEPAVHPGLIGLPNVVLAPHIASASHETRLRMATLAVENCMAVLEGKTPPTPVNPEVLKRA